MDAGHRFVVRFRARAWAGPWSRKLPARVAESVASFCVHVKLCDSSMRVDDGLGSWRDKTSCEDDDSQRARVESICPNPNPGPDYNISL